jgi:uncharacterized protein YceH (UPF0502 family)
VDFSELTPPELRVLGCLIEKRWTRPDHYPLSLNALRRACNQATNRDPVTDYDEETVHEAAERLSRYGLARLANGRSSRSVKYRDLAEEGLDLDREELAVLAVLLLRGSQTPGELKARGERIAPIGSLKKVEQILETLIDRGYARRIGRRSRQKEDRFVHVLGDSGEADLAVAEAEIGTQPQPLTIDETLDHGPSLLERIAALEDEMAALRLEVAQLRAERDAR